MLFRPEIARFELPIQKYVFENWKGNFLLNVSYFFPEKVNCCRKDVFSNTYFNRKESFQTLL